jgi:hypothetical protein
MSEDPKQQSTQPYKIHTNPNDYQILKTNINTNIIPNNKFKT